MVPAGPGWTREPFRSEVVDDRVFGRGATDMKGGLADVMSAMDALRRPGTPLSGPLRLACTVDEEDLGLGIRHLSSRGLGRDFLGCVVAEPTDLQPVIACRGDMDVELGVTGVPDHSGRPADGRDAIDAASRILELTRADHEQQDPLLGAGTWNIGRIEGGRATSMPGFRTPEEHPVALAAHDSVARAGGAASIGGWTAACDGGSLARDMGVPTIVMGPGGLNDQAHQIDESVGIDELVQAARAYALIALRLLAA